MYAKYVVLVLQFLNFKHKYFENYNSKSGELPGSVHMIQISKIWCYLKCDFANNETTNLGNKSFHV